MSTEVGVPTNTNYKPSVYVLGAPICIRAYRAAWYHLTCGCPLTKENMEWVVVEAIGEQILAIEEMMVESRNTKPIPLKNGNHPLWLEDTKTQMLSMIIHQKLPYAYMTRKDEAPPDPHPDLLEEKPYSKEHGSVIMELVMCASWDHVLMGQERALLYDNCKVGWKGTNAISILVGAIQRDKDGIKAF